MSTRTLLVTAVLLAASAVASQSAHENDPFEAEGANDPFFGCLEPAPDVGTSVPGVLFEARTLRLIVLADHKFVDRHPVDWRDLLTDLVADASDLYERQLDLSLEPVLIDALPTNAIRPGGADDEMSDVARGYVNTFYPDLEKDVVALVLGADYAGSTAGQAECIGGAGRPDQAYFWSEYNEPRDDSLRFGPVSMFEDAALKVFAHELAHILGAHHHYTDCVEPIAAYNLRDAMGVCGLMINDIGLASYTISAVNRKVIQDHVVANDVGVPSA